MEKNDNYNDENTKIRISLSKNCIVISVNL